MAPRRSARARAGEAENNYVEERDEESEVNVTTKKPRARSNKKSKESVEAPPPLYPAVAPGKKRNWAEMVAIARSVPLVTKENWAPEPKQSNRPRKKQPTPPSQKDWESRSDPGNQPGDKRMKGWLTAPTPDFKKVYDRAFLQRMFLMDRERGGTGEHPTEKLMIAGTTGNMYTVTIDQKPKCDCPHPAVQCKHIVYAMVRALHAPEYLVYQTAFLRSELREIFNNAPPIVRVSAKEKEDSPNRKPIDKDTDCPICCENLDPGDGATVYCKAACGNNLHKQCFDMWATTKGDDVTCPFCRTPWVDDCGAVKHRTFEGETTVSEGISGQEYRNIGAYLGLSGKRDKSILIPQQQKSTDDGCTKNESYSAYIPD